MTIAPASLLNKNAGAIVIKQNAKPYGDGVTVLPIANMIGFAKESRPVINPYFQPLQFAPCLDPIKQLIIS